MILRGDPVLAGFHEMPSTPHLCDGALSGSTAKKLATLAQGGPIIRWEIAVLPSNLLFEILLSIEPAAGARQVGRMTGVLPICACGRARSFVLDFRVLVGGVVDDRETDVGRPARRRCCVYWSRNFCGDGEHDIGASQYDVERGEHIVLCKR